MDCDCSMVCFERENVFSDFLIKFDGGKNE